MKNVIYHAVKDAVAMLKASESSFSKHIAFHPVKSELVHFLKAPGHSVSSTGYLGSDGHTGLAGQLELLGNQTFPLQGTLTCRTQEAALKVALVSVK